MAKIDNVAYRFLTMSTGQLLKVDSFMFHGYLLPYIGQLWIRDPRLLTFPSESGVERYNEYMVFVVPRTSLRIPLKSAGFTFCKGGNRFDTAILLREIQRRLAITIRVSPIGSIFHQAANNLNGTSHRGIVQRCLAAGGRQIHVRSEIYQTEHNHTQSLALELKNVIAVSGAWAAESSYPLFAHPCKEKVLASSTVIFDFWNWSIPCCLEEDMCIYQTQSRIEMK